jgi:hypothetical protein
MPAPLCEVLDEGMHEGSEVGSSKVIRQRLCAVVCQELHARMHLQIAVTLPVHTVVDVNARDHL